MIRYDILVSREQRRRTLISNYERLRACSCLVVKAEQYCKLWPEDGKLVMKGAGMM